MGADAPTLDDKVKAFFAKFSWEAFPSKHLKYFEIGAFDLETSLAVDQVCHITDQEVTDDDCESLSMALQTMRPENLKQIYLTNNKIGDAGCAAVAAGAAALPSFELLYIATNQIADAGLAAIAQQLPKSKMYQLVLSENKIGDEGICALARAVEADATAFADMKWLFLDQNHVGDKGVAALAKAMVTGLKAVERLALQDNKLTNAALFSLAKAIEAGALAKCEYLYVRYAPPARQTLSCRKLSVLTATPTVPTWQVQNNGFDKVGKNALRAATKPRGIKVHFGWPPPLPGVDYDD